MAASRADPSTTFVLTTASTARPVDKVNAFESSLPKSFLSPYGKLRKKIHTKRALVDAWVRVSIRPSKSRDVLFQDQRCRGSTGAGFGKMDGVLAVAGDAGGGAIVAAQLLVPALAGGSLAVLGNAAGKCQAAARGRGAYASPVSSCNDAVVAGRCQRGACQAAD